MLGEGGRTAIRVADGMRRIDTVAYQTWERTRILHAELQAQDVMHDRSHLMTPDVFNVYAYQKVIQEEILHEHKWHHKHFPSLAKITSTRERSNNVFETG